METIEDQNEASNRHEYEREWSAISSEDLDGDGSAGWDDDDDDYENGENADFSSIHQGAVDKDIDSEPSCVVRSSHFRVLDKLDVRQRQIDLIETLAESLHISYHNAETMLCFSQ